MLSVCLLHCRLVERTAGTMMQRMSDMLTRWLEGAMRRSENEAEADESHDQSDSSEHESTSQPAQTSASSAVEECVEASLQDVANLRLSPSPVSDATERVSEVVNDALCSASREVQETVQCEPVDSAPVLTDRTCSRSDESAVSGNNDSIVDSRPDQQSRASHDSEADSELRNTVHLKTESHDTNSGCTSTSVVDGADSSELIDESCRSHSGAISTRLHSQCDQVTVSVDEKNKAAEVEKNPASHC